MTRLFHAKISIGNYVLLSVLLTVAIYFVWQIPFGSRQILGAIVCIILLTMVIIVERMINTTYTLTDEGMLIIHKGRFAKDIVVSVDDITEMTHSDQISLFGKGLYSSLIIETKDNGKIAIRPDNEADFVNKVNKLINRNNEYEDDEED